jgi:NTP pyrophosphatase (non-canonical NTP hydrolase)
MNLDELQARALEIAELYDKHHVAAGRAPWSTGDLALGFVGDVGDLAKLVMAVDGRRVIPHAEAGLGHELADCLWSVLVLAGRYDVDLVAEFTRMTEGIQQNLESTGTAAVLPRSVRESA